MDFSLSRHAQEQLAKRRLPLYLLRIVLERPQQIVEEEGAKIYQSQFDRNGKMHLLRIVVKDNVSPVLVVTLYDTSKVQKYWRQK